MKFKYLYTIYFLIISFSLFPQNILKDKQKINAIWVYSFEKDDNDTLLKKIKDSGFNTAFVSIAAAYLVSPRHVEYQNKVIDFLEKAKDRDISIHALICEQPKYTKIEYHNLALTEINKIKKFLKTNSNLVLDGIQLDIEPHALDEWKNLKNFNSGKQEDLLKQWLILHKKISERLLDTNIPLSTVITWWYDSKFREGVLPSGNTELLSEYVEFIVVMTFSKALPPYEQAEDESHIMPTVIATNSEIYNSYNDLKIDRDNIEEVFNNNPNYLGQSLFHLSIIPKE